jgi:hypothetical protein
MYSRKKRGPNIVEVPVILIAQAQHINNRKYTNSYTINYECRQLSIVVAVKRK